jgi:hypothetical protein
MKTEKRLKELGIELTKATSPLANYVNAVRTGNLLYLAGKGPGLPGHPLPVGKVGRDFTKEQGYEYARQTGLSIIFGGRFVAETLMPLILELERPTRRPRPIPRSRPSSTAMLKHYVGRPSPLYFAERLTEHLGGAKIYLKREDLNHTGAHKINNCLGQILLARRMGKTAHHRRDRRRPARRRHRHGLRALRPALRRLHGRGRRRAAEAQRLPHEAAGRRRCVPVKSARAR